MFKDRIVLKIVLVAVVLALGFSAWFYWSRPAPGIDRGVPCKWNPNHLNGKADTCEAQCSPTYFGGTKNEIVLNEMIVHVCCSKGWSAFGVEDLQTKKIIDVVCMKDAK
jgi:hypothetical protein